MNLSRLLIFNEAAESLNFSKAASRLNVTQPAVSAQIRVLEENLGVKLFARLGKRIVLTEAGEVLLGYSRKIFKLREEAESVMKDLRLVRRGTLKIGTTHTYAGHIMPPLLARFQAAFPQVNVVLHEGSSVEMTRSLASLVIEVAVVAWPGPVKRITFSFLKRENLVLIGRPGHSLSGIGPVPVRYLADETFVMREKGSGTRWVVDDLFQRHRINPRVVFEASNAEVIKEQVSAGVGLSFLTHSSVLQEVQNRRLAIIELESENLRLDIHTAVLAGHELSQPAQAFLNMLADT